MTASLELFVAPKMRLKTEYPFLFQFYDAAAREKQRPGVVGSRGRVVVPVSAKGSLLGFSLLREGAQLGKRVVLAPDSFASDDDEVTVRGSRKACDFE